MVYYSHYPSDCPICEDAGRAENWRKDENLHQTSTYPSELRTSSVNCLLCEAILLGLQQSPQGRALLEDTKEFRLDLRRRSRFDFPSWKNEYFEVNCLEFARDGLSCAFELFRTSADVRTDELASLSVLPVRDPIPVHALSSDILSIIMKWLSLCIEAHEHSPNIGSRTVPDRLIDVRPSTNSEPVLIEDTANISAPYLALSHCWGGTVPYRTLKSNKADLCKRIDTSRLAQNFKDAFTVTRWLGYRYIWIDSFCIVQDDTQDWLKQSSKMAAIFSGAFLTICATRSPSSDHGFLSDRCTDNRLELSHGILVGAGIYARNNESLASSHAGLEGEPTNNSPLCHRAWAFQERLVAPRVLHFMEGELVLECQEELLCQCNDYNYHTVLRPQQLCLRSLEDKCDNEMEKRWLGLASRYTALNLTYPQDVLAAFSAIARTQGISCYLAGINGDDLMFDLLWHMKTFINDYGGEQIISRRPPVYTAPSFSWASVIGAVGWYYEVGRDDLQPAAKLEQSYVELENPDDPFGPVRDGWIILSGPVVYATLTSKPSVIPDGFCGSVSIKPMKKRVYIDDRGGSMKTYVFFDTLDDVLSTDVVLFAIYKSRHIYYHHILGLALQAIDAEKTAYRRVGAFYECDLDAFLDAPTKSVKIV